VKVYIAVDSEGEACVTREQDPDTVYGTWQAEYIRTRATAEASAAVVGAREAGADDILVHDCGFIRGASPVGLVLHYDDLPRGIHIALGGAPIQRLCDETYDAAVLLGHHAMAGVDDGVMAHTFSSLAIECMRLNGRPVGEIGMEALVFGACGVPVVMVSADEAGCREAQEWLGPVEVAPTKQGLARHWAISLHPEDACELIRGRTRAALGRLGEFEPFLPPPPYEVQVDCFTEELARTRFDKLGPVAEMIGPRTYAVRADSPVDLRW